MWVDIEQNNDDWLLLRSGKATGSVISCVMANSIKKKDGVVTFDPESAFGDPAKKLAVDIAVQQLTGRIKENGYSNDHMERGHAEEPLARELYEDEYFCEVTNGGFFDNGFTGCSPDGIVGDGIIEIKSVIASTQYKTIKKQSFDSAYRWQITFNLKESGADWLDYISFSSEFPLGNQLFVKRVFAKDLMEDFERIDARLVQFKELVDAIKNDINSLPNAA